MEFIKKNKGLVDYILFLRWDRYSRNLYESLGMIEQLKKLGVKVNASEQEINTDDNDQLVQLALYLVIPETENRKNSQRTIEGSRQTRLQGWWTGKALWGYKNFRTIENKSTLTRTHDAETVSMIFFGDVNGRVLC